MGISELNRFWFLFYPAAFRLILAVRNIRWLQELQSSACVTRHRKREYHFHKNPRGLHHMTSIAGLQSYSCSNVDMTYTSFLIFSLKDHSNSLPQNLAPLTHFVLVMTLISRLVMRIVPW